MIFLVIALLLAILYMAIQFQYIYYWKKIVPVTVPKEFIPSKAVSIIIVARNESDTIANCLQGIVSQNYPQYLLEIIVVDDHSEDDTVNKILSFKNDRIHLLRLSEYAEYIHSPAYKKSAIALGVSKATSDIILVTDSDCYHSPEWLTAIVFAMEKENAAFQASPVLLVPGNSLLEKMQETEMLVFMLITGSGIQSRLHDLANGANMAFRKSAFQSVKGYEGNYKYASGDDMFLIEKMRTAFPDQINFTKSIPATVLTRGKTTWSALLKQRLRWASKNKGLNNKTISLIWFFVGFYHFTMFLFLFLAVFHILRWEPFLVMLSFKWVADYFLLQQATSFFNRISVLRNFILLQFLYALYIFRLTLFILFNKKSDWSR